MDVDIKSGTINHIYDVEVEHVKGVEVEHVKDVEIEHVRVQRAGDIEHACADLARLASVGAPKPRWTSRDAIADFIRASWATPGATSAAWDDALDELARRGLVNGSHG